MEDHWKPVWACFGCRKAVKLPEPGSDDPHVRMCGSCGKETLRYMGWDWKAPKRHQKKKWKKLEKGHCDE